MDTSKAFYMSALSGALQSATSFFRPGELPADVLEAINKVHHFFYEASEDLQHGLAEED